MGNHDFMPQADAALLVYAQDYLAAFAPLAETVWDFGAAETAALAGAVTAYETALEAALNRGRREIIAKNTARSVLKGLLRSYTARVQAHPATTDAHRAALGITIRQKHRGQVEIPSVYPHLILETAGYLTVKITFYFEHPERLALPREFLGAMLRFRIGEEAAADFEDLNQARLMCESPFIFRLPQEADLKTFSCSAAWLVSGGRQGPLCPIVSLQAR